MRRCLSWTVDGGASRFVTSRTSSLAIMRHTEKTELYGPFLAIFAQKHDEIAVFESHTAARAPEWRPYLVTRTIHVLPTEFGTVAVYAVIKQVDAGRSRPGKGDNA